MYVIENVLISEDIFAESFFCHLEKCKGACCWEGDYGAPLAEEELFILDEIQEKIYPYLPEKSVELLENNGGYIYEKKYKTWATRCHEDGACTYLNIDPVTSIAQCGIERAHQDGNSSFVKPLSCHLYPIRITLNPAMGFEAWNYDRWEICNAACSLGAEKKMPIFRFVKTAIIRAKGEAFYEQMEAIYNEYFMK